MKDLRDNLANLSYEEVNTILEALSDYLDKLVTTSFRFQKGLLATKREEMVVLEVEISEVKEIMRKLDHRNEYQHAYD